MRRSLLVGTTFAIPRCCTCLSTPPRWPGRTIQAARPQNPVDRFGEPVASHGHPHCRRADASGARRAPGDRQWILHALACDQLPMAPEAQRRLLLPHAYRTGRLTHQLLALYFYGRYCTYGPIADQARASCPASPSVSRKRRPSTSGSPISTCSASSVYSWRGGPICETALGGAGARRSTDQWRLEVQLERWDRGFSGSISPQPTSAHATAQGLWLTSLIKDRHPQWIAQHYR